MRILITGATGFLGRHLAKSLQGSGAQVVATSRDAARARARLGDSVEAFSWDYRSEPFPEDALRGVSCVFHLMGENIGSGRWTRRKKEALRGSRIESTRKLVAALPDSVTDFLCASAIGIYPGDTHERFDETRSLPPAASFMTHLCSDWEAAAEVARSPARRVARLRIGLVLGEAGMLAPLVPLYRLGLGGPLGDGQQRVPWIHIDDLVASLRFVREQRALSGAVNLVGPAPAPLLDLSQALAKTLGRPHLVRVPAFAIRAILGEASAMLLSSYNVEPRQLLEAGFRFRFSTVEETIADVVHAHYSRKAGS